MRWLQTEVEITNGWRLDYVRGFSGVYVKKYMEATDVHFGVGEYWDTLSYDYDTPNHDQNDHTRRIINWIDDAGGASGAFDVTTKGIMHAVFERQEYWRLCDSGGTPAGCRGALAQPSGDVHRRTTTRDRPEGHWRFPEGSGRGLRRTSSRTRARPPCSGITCSSGTTNRWEIPSLR